MLNIRFTLLETIRPDNIKMRIKRLEMGCAKV